jgi:phosphate butyryltransferase
MSYTTLEQLADKVRNSGRGARTVSVINATESHVLEAVRDAQKDGLISPILFGDKDVITEQLELLGLRPADFAVEHAASPEEAAVKAGQSLASGRADFLMKGNIPTGNMLKALFSKDADFRTGNLISHLSIIELPDHPKLFGLTDAAINIAPDLEQKKGIIRNAVATMRAMGFLAPKVAVLASTEVPNPKMQATMDAVEIKKAGAAGELGDCVVEGPISYDLAMSPESARIKKFDSPIQGDADLLAAPDINAANVLIKALRYAGHSRSAGIVIGGRGPIVLTSRAAATQDKYWPLVLAASATLGDN